MHRLAPFVRANTVAIIALFIALGGTSIAAIEIPKGSVGTPQLRNGAITPVKMNPGLFGGYVRAWAHVSESGTIYASRGFKRHVSVASSPAGTFVLFPTNASIRGCSALASVTPTEAAASATPGFANANIIVPSQATYPKGVGVATYAAGGQPTALPFVVEVLC